MLAFPGTNPVTLSMWLQAHAQKRPIKFWWDHRWYQYCLVDDDFNPDMGICFGYDPGNNMYYISDNVPEEIRVSIVCIERLRIMVANDQRHAWALEFYLEKMPRSNKKTLLVETLTHFYSELVRHFEEGCETLESLDAKAALKYLRSLS